MKTIQINHIAKTEGHLSFVGALIDNNFAQARIETEEGARLIEGILLGRKYYEAPIITSRVCGVCPIVHNLTAIKALEQALNIKVTPEIAMLRKMLLAAQWIHSHALHAFFLSFPDLIGISNNFDFVQKFPSESRLALSVREWGVELARVIGGRTVHPINSVVGGFNIEPDFSELSALIERTGEILKKAIALFDFCRKQKLPRFVNPTNYISLRTSGEYAVSGGKVHFSDNDEEKTENETLSLIEEMILPHERVKRVKHFNQPIMVGALARVNNNYHELNGQARKCWDKLRQKVPCYNSFYNTFAQATEIVHCVEEIQKLFKKYAALRVAVGFEKKLKVKFKPNPGRGVAAIEAPRGLLFHEYELDKSGNILHCNIITPTAIFLANLENDLEKFLVENNKQGEKKLKHLVRTLIRAYDPCVSCATH
ncbi:Ni/Fe hydrogenase subunit alpha [Candidatus Falkowbacteria bacterium]|nr:Ni/Fe hydrogenase subunit alpha [Candidatus Falkowbacteria bacterium]